MKVVGTCHICGSPSMKNCVACGKAVCNGCLDRATGACVQCYKGKAF